METPRLKALAQTIELAKGQIDEMNIAQNARMEIRSNLIAATARVDYLIAQAERLEREQARQELLAGRRKVMAAEAG